jgi:hypothetical protein
LSWLQKIDGDLKSLVNHLGGWMGGLTDVKLGLRDIFVSKKELASSIYMKPLTRPVSFFIFTS